METRNRRSRTVTWEDPFEVLKAAPGRTGLELLKEVFEKRLPPPPIAQTMGFTGVHVEAIDPGRQFTGLVKVQEPAVGAKRDRLFSRI